jgi:hypothetical protein
VKRVQVDHRYTYETDLDVREGDTVALPPGGINNRIWFGTVTSLDGGDYAGPCVQVLRAFREEVTR